ncbi:MAG: hypothetical protein OXF25_09370 [Cyanobacteria bacterium MAG CAR3_bin_5]|nr:hypothetical protein [Cyanobacteria bacterium MAG CAR3_bin_5]
MATATALLFYRCLRSLQQLGFLSRQIRRPWMVLCSTLLLCLSQTHPGALSGHLHLFANGFLVLALYLFLKCFRVNPEQHDRVVVWQLLAGGSLAWAIQTRPNLLVSVGCCGLVWFIVRCLQKRLGWREGSAVGRLALGAVVLSLPFILPYLLHPDGLALLKAGGWDLLHQWNSERYGIRPHLGLPELLKAMYWDRHFVDFPFYGLPLLPIPILLFLNLYKSPSRDPRSWTATIWIPLFSSSFILGLWLSYLKTHFWPHYMLLEVVPVTLLFAWIPQGLAQVQVRLPRALGIGFTWIGIIVGSFIVFNLVVVEPVRLLSASLFLPREHSADARAQEIVYQRLQSLPSGEHFFVPGDPSFHWKLQEPMPVKGISRAWMFDPAVSLSQTPATQRMGIATSPVERCNQLLSQPADITIWSEGKASLTILHSCLAASEDDWQDLTEEWGLMGSKYHIFQRRS